MARLLDQRQLEDVLQENAPRVAVWDTAVHEDLRSFTRGVLVVVATLVIVLALVLSFWPPRAGAHPGPGPGPAGVAVAAIARTV